LFSAGANTLSFSGHFGNPLLTNEGLYASQSYAALAPDTAAPRQQLRIVT
tara:strand:+ start:448 stop:597 length:150 start_codon:yes stop_codon:yes gene_type:complete